MLNIINQIMDECIPYDRANRDFSVKFPEEIRHDNLAGQLWFGAEVVYSPQRRSRRKQPSNNRCAKKHSDSCLIVWVLFFILMCAVVNIIF